MQSVNVIPNIPTQDADLHIKERTAQNEYTAGEASFLGLVNEHVMADEEVSVNKKNAFTKHTRASDSRKNFATPINNEQHDEVNSERVSVLDNLDENQTLLIEADKKASLNSAEQLLSLLNSSNKTLTPSKITSEIVQTDTEILAHKDQYEPELAINNTQFKEDEVDLESTVKEESREIRSNKKIFNAPIVNNIDGLGVNDSIVPVLPAELTHNTANQTVALQVAKKVIDDTVILKASDMNVDGKLEAITVDKKNNNLMVTQETNRIQPPNSREAMLSFGETTNDNNLHDFNLSKQITDNNLQQKTILTHNTNAVDVLPEQRIKQNVGQTPSNSNEENDQGPSADNLVFDIKDELANNTNPALVKVGSKVEDNAKSTHELNFLTSQMFEGKQISETHLTHQLPEVVDNISIVDVQLIQKNKASLQQETISIYRKDFADAIKDKIVILINQKLNKVEITLDPPEFGNMQVRVNLQGDQASVNFIVQNAQAKESLEHNMQKLKEMLSEQGVDVGKTTIEQHSQGGRNSQEQSLFSQGSISENSPHDEESQQVLIVNSPHSSTSAVDYYV